MRSKERYKNTYPSVYSSLPSFSYFSLLLSKTAAMKLSLALLATFFAATAAREDDAITFSSLSAQELVENYFRNPYDPVEFRNVAASDHSCFALFANGHYAGRHEVTNQFLLPNKGIIMSTGKPEDFHINDSPETTTDFEVTIGDVHLEHNVKHGTKVVLDPCFIQFEFSCPEATDIYTPQVSFDYVFGSEEYFHKKKKEEEVVDEEALNRGAYPDVLGFFLNGQNIAFVPDENGGVAPVSIEDVNEKRNTQYFVNNKSKVNSTSLYSTIEADGFTSKLTAQGAAKPGWNVVKLAIGDVGDGNIDSWVLLEAGTFSCALGEAPKYYVRPSTEEGTFVASKEDAFVASEEGETESPQKMSGVAVFFIVLVVIFVVGWTLLASGAVEVKKAPNGRPAVAFSKPNFKPSAMKAKSIGMLGTIKAKSSETYGAIKAKSSEKFGSKKVKPSESTAASSKAAKQDAEQPVQQPVKQPVQQPVKQPVKQPVQQPVKQTAELLVDEEADSIVEEIDSFDEETDSNV
jgi:hypothetical protein